MWARFYLDQYKNIKLESVIFVRAKMILLHHLLIQPKPFRKSDFSSLQEIVPSALINIDKE